MLRQWLSFWIIFFILNISLAQLLPQFSEETKHAGISHIYDGDWHYFTGGGVAAFDCSGDGYPELFLAGGEKPSSFYLNKSAQGGPLAFEKLDTLNLTQVTGAYPIDIDSDGLIDLVVLRVGANHIYRGLGMCKFEEASKHWNFDGGNAWSTAFSATWLENDSWPTMVVGNYIDLTNASPFGHCSPHQVFQPANGTFLMTHLEPAYCALSALFSDWNHSGKASLFLSNDRQYYLSNKDRSGSEQLMYFHKGELIPYTKEDGWQSLQIWGMGIATSQFPGQAYPEYYFTSMGDNKLRVLDSQTQPTFKDTAYDRGATAHRPYIADRSKPSTAWHVDFADLNNDGYEDLFVVKGNVEAMNDYALQDPNNLLLQGADRQFKEFGDAAGIASLDRGRGGAVVDLNLDGNLDLVIVNRKAKAQVWRNITGNSHNWLELRLEHPDNSFGISSWIELKTKSQTQLKELTLGGGHVSGQLGFSHFGMGTETRGSLRIHWFNGEISNWFRVNANTIYVVNPYEIKRWLPQSGNSKVNLPAEQAENQRLKRELELVKQEQGILKKP